MSKFPFKPNPPYIPDPYLIPQQKQKSNEMKTPEEMAEDYIRYENESAYWTKHAFLAGYKAAQAIVEEELQAVQAQRPEYPGLGAAQYALKNVLAKMGSK